MGESASGRLTVDNWWGRLGMAGTVRVGEGVPGHRWNEGGAWAQLGSQWLTSPLE